MKNVLLIATTTGYQIRSFGEAAGSLGVGLVFASDRCDQLDDPWWDHAIPIRFHHEAQSVDAVVAAFDGAAPAGILAVGDRPAQLAARIAEAFGITGNPPAAAAASRDKLATRRLLQAAGLPTPAFEPVPIGADAAAVARTIRYPAVIKPLALSGSRGVMRVDDERSFEEAFARLRRLLQSDDVRRERDPAHDSAVIESFIPGAEVAVEGLLSRGSLRVLAVFDKPDPLNGPFFEETIYVTPSRAPDHIRQRIAASVAAAAAALGLYHGPIHAECRIDGETVYVLEVAARPIGGLCSRALRFGPAGMSLEELLLRHALGEELSQYQREAPASGVMMIPIPQRGIFRRVEGLDEARTVPAIEDVQITAKTDALLTPLPEARSYLGFIFARAAAPADVEAALRGAHARLRFVIDREVPLLSEG